MADSHACEPPGAGIDIDARIAVLEGHFPDLVLYRRPEEADLVAIEHQIGAPLPAPYRAFLLRYGGVAPYGVKWTLLPDATDWSAGAAPIDGFFGFGSAGNPRLTRPYALDMARAVDVWRDRVGRDFLPIAEWE